MSTQLMGWTALAVCAGLAGCSAATLFAANSEKMAAAEIGTIERLHALGKIYLASQPSAADFAVLRQRGLVSVVNLRMPSELDFDEAIVVEDLGMRYHNPAFASPDTLTDATLDRVRALLSDTSEQPLLLHCASANRVGAVWLAHRVLDDGVDLDAALDEARQVGLRSAPLEERVRQYIVSQSAGR